MTILALNYGEPAEIISGRQQTVCTVASVKWSLRISIPTSSSRPLNHKASNTLIISWDHPACCGGRIKTTHNDSVTEANTWSRGGGHDFSQRANLSVCLWYNQQWGSRAERGISFGESLHPVITSVWIFPFPQHEKTSALFFLALCSLDSFLHLSSCILAYKNIHSLFITPLSQQGCGALERIPADTGQGVGYTLDRYAFTPTIKNHHLT